MSEVKVGSELSQNVEDSLEYLKSIENPSIEVRSAIVEGTKFLTSIRSIDPLEFNNVPEEASVSTEEENENPPEGEESNKEKE